MGRELAGTTAVWAKGQRLKVNSMGKYAGQIQAFGNGLLSVRGVQCMGPVSGWDLTVGIWHYNGGALT